MPNFFDTRLFEIISIGSGPIKTTKTIDAELCRYSKSAYYLYWNLSIAQAYLHKTENEFSFFTFIGRATLNELWDMNALRLIESIDNRSNFLKGTAEYRSKRIIEVPIFIFVYLPGVLAQHILIKLIDLLKSNNKKVLVFTQRPMRIEAKKRHEAAEKMFKELQDSGVSIVLNDFPLDEFIPDNIFVHQAFNNNDNIIMESFYAIYKLMEFYFFHPEVENFLLSFFEKQELLLFGYSIATNVNQLISAVVSAKEQISNKLKRIHRNEEAEIEAYTTIISYYNCNPEHYLAEHKKQLQELIPPSNTVISIVDSKLAGKTYQFDCLLE